MFLILRDFLATYERSKCVVVIYMYNASSTGTGCNAAYLEDLDNVDKWEGEKNHPKQVWKGEPCNHLHCC